MKWLGCERNKPVISSIIAAQRRQVGLELTIQVALTLGQIALAIQQARRAVVANVRHWFWTIFKPKWYLYAQNTNELY